MTPEPTPCWRAPVGSVESAAPVVILTTAGLSFAATSMTADDSLRVTCCCEPAVGVALPTVEDWTGRSKAPARSRTSTVPAEATTADRSDAAMTVGSPGPERRSRTTGAVATGGSAAGAADQPGCAQEGPLARAGSPGAGSYQRSEAGCPVGDAHAQRASGRGSGVGA